jgi:hypothetical protein
MRREPYRTWLADGTGLFLLARNPARDSHPLGYLFGRIFPSGPTFDLGPDWAQVDSLSVASSARAEASARPCSTPAGPISSPAGAATGRSA